MQRYLLDFIIMNLITFTLSFFTTLMGKELTDTFILVLFLESGFMLILGGLAGFLLTGVSFQAIVKFFRRDKTVPKLKDKTMEKRSTSNRVIILGATLLAESILLSLAMM